MSVMNTLESEAASRASHDASAEMDTRSGDSIHGQWSQRFWLRVDKSAGPSACWSWTGSTLPTGYGRFFPAFKVGLYAHRVSWEIANGRSIPDGLHVMHSCDNPRCVNPAHLSVGTHSDNMRDCVFKGRARRAAPRGEKHHNAKLTKKQIDEIRSRAAAGKIHRALGAEYGVTRACISGIVRGESWRRCDPTPEAAR